MSTITPILIAILTGGLLAYVRDLVKWIYERHQASKPDRIEAQKIHESVAQADQSVIVVARARDLLAADNARLRIEIAEDAKRHAADRAEWTAERAELRREIDELEERLRGALDEVRALKAKHNMTGPPPVSA